MQAGLLTCRQSQTSSRETRNRAQYLSLNTQRSTISSDLLFAPKGRLTAAGLSGTLTRFPFHLIKRDTCIVPAKLLINSQK